MQNRRRLWCALTFVGSLAASRPAWAQINTATPQKITPGLSGQAEGSLTGRTGNVNGIIAGSAATVMFSRDPHGLIFKASGDYTRFNHVTTVAKSFLYGRYGYRFTSWPWGEVFAQVQQDKFRRMKLRQLAGIGPRFALVQEETISVFTGTAYMPEYEVLDVPPGATDESPVFTHRMNNYMTIYINLDARLSFTSTTMWQPEIVNVPNSRVLSENSFSFDVSKRVTAKIISSVRHDGRAPTGVVPTDVEIKNAFVVKF